MTKFLNQDFLLQTNTAASLYHNHAAQLPIIDYHCHLDPRQIAEDCRFDNLTDIWLGSDHYKWRAMRANGVDERYITGQAPPFDKFLKWADTMQHAMRNPLYHWTHLELRRIFNIDKTLNPSTAHEIYEECTAKLQTPDFSARNILTRMKVEAVCTTDDPIDPLTSHDAIRQSGYPVKVLPTWRPDKAMQIDNPDAYNLYLNQLELAAGIPLRTYDDLLEALHIRRRYFASRGCLVSDHGLDTFYAEPYTLSEIRAIFLKARAGQTVSPQESAQFRSALLYEGGRADCEDGWTQQFHVGVVRNNNSRLYNAYGPDAGCDSMHDKNLALSMNRFLDRLDRDNRLARTIVYNLNPKDTGLILTTLYNFNDGTTPGKMQYGAAWWFLDQLQGIENQINALSSLGLLSRFVGMLTDSRSILSYPRHEYFRRILCNIIGSDVEKGELPESELPFIAQMIENISYYNAKRYFGL